MTRLPNLRQLHYFSVVAETLNFRAASSELNIAQSAISRAVRDLEVSLGQPLLERTTRSVRLSPQGKALAEGIGRAWREIETALREVEQIAEGERGELVVGYSAQATHGPMSRLLLEFKKAHPHVVIRLRLLSSEEQIQQIEAGAIDLGFLLSAGVKPGIGHLEIARERLVALLPMLHPLAERRSIPLAALRSEPFIMGTTERWKVFRTITDSACLQSGFLPDVVGVADDVPLLLEMISAGQGVTLFGSAIRHSLPPGVVAVPLDEGTSSFGISLAWRGEIGNALPLMRLLVGFTREADIGKSRPQGDGEPETGKIAVS